LELEDQSREEQLTWSEAGACCHIEKIFIAFIAVTPVADRGFEDTGALSAQGNPGFTCCKVI